MSEEPTASASPTPETAAAPSLIGTPPATAPTSEATPAPPEAPAKAEEKPAEKAAEVVPLTVDDFKDFEGFKADDPNLKAFVDIQNDVALSPKDRAAKVLELQKTVMKSISEEGDRAFIKMQEDWQGEVKAMPEFANGKLEPALGGISKVIDRFGTPKLREAFDYTGAGNHPEVVKFLHKISLVLNEPTGDPSRVHPAEAPKDFASILYPNQGKS